MKKSIFIFLTFILIATVFLTNFFIPKNFIKFPLKFFSSGFSSGLFKENQSLKLQNEILRAQIQQMKHFPGRPASLGNEAAKKDLLAARVFSTYPFNVKNILSLDLGEGDGARKGMAGTIGGEILVGQVTGIFENYAALKTVFNPDWELPVKIGEGKINGLFKGGNEPKITLVEKEVKVGDVVFTAGAGVPLDLKIGEISQIKEASGGIFKEAQVRVPYDIGDLEFVDLLVK